MKYVYITIGVLIHLLCLPMYLCAILYMALGIGTDLLGIHTAGDWCDFLLWPMHEYSPFYWIAQVSFWFFAKAES